MLNVKIKLKRKELTKGKASSARPSDFMRRGDRDTNLSLEPKASYDRQLRNVQTRLASSWRFVNDKVSECLEQ